MQPQIRNAIASITAVLALACADTNPTPAPPSSESASAAIAEQPQAALPAPADRDVRQEFDKWSRVAKSGMLLLRSAADGELTPGPVLDTTVEIAVSGLLARVSVRQRFSNPGDTWAEGVYVFPLPDDAAVDHMRILTESRVLEGQIQEKEEARKTYEQAKSAGMRASLVEQERPNVFTTYVANIRPGSQITVEIEYQQSVQIDAGEFSLRFPMVVAPRHLPGEPLGEERPVGADWERDADAPAETPESGPVRPVQIRVDLVPGFEIGAIESPYHPIRVDENGAGYRATLVRDETPANRDFVLQWWPAPGDAPWASIFTESLDGAHYALLMVTPPHQPESGVQPPPRDVIYVIDTSGSMLGTSLAQAQAALAFALGRLRPWDRFNVIAFDTSPTPLFAESLHASRPNLERALRFVDDLEAEGGTNILPAIRMALADRASHPADLRQIVFLTDGSVANEAALFAEIHAQLGRSRLFAVGIGSAPNIHFMRKAAQFGRGTFTHIGSPDEVAEKMTGLFRKLESVVMADIEIELPNGDRVDQHPEYIADLYAGEPVVVALKLDDPLDWVGVTGHTGDAPWQVTLDHRDVEERPGVHVLWARRKIASLMDDRVGVDDERDLETLREDVVRVALDHHLVSAYTSLVAVDVTPVRRGHESLASHALAPDLPAGWSDEDAFGMARGATGADLRIALGLLLLTCGGALRRLRAAS